LTVSLKFTIFCSDKGAFSALIRVDPNPVNIKTALLSKYGRLGCCGPKRSSASRTFPIKESTLLALRPYHYLLIYGLIPLGYYLLRGYLFLLRIRVVGEEIALGCLGDYGRLIVAVWHQRLLAAVAYVLKFRNFDPIIMISQSKDGELATRLARRFGFVPVRGSSSKGGTSALFAITEALKTNPTVIHIVDGPRGPKGVVKPGLISMAGVSGAVILPLIVSAKKAWILGSWDRFMIPKPFSEVTIEWGRPFVVPRDSDPETHEEFRREIEMSLAAGHAEADLNSGWHKAL
jgi:lysophospholipid acyltransferase (LPLAT)-like uncharacterized protein